MLCSALKQADCLRGVVMMRVIIRLIGLERSIGGRRVLPFRGDLSGLRLRLPMLLLAGIVLVVGAASEMLMVIMPVAVMAFVGRMMIGEITLFVRLAGPRQSA